MKRLVPNAAEPLTQDELARPLTADEEDYFRTYGVSQLDARQVRRLVPRLLATLDALRATPVADTAEPDAPLFFEPCRDFDKPQSCYTNDGTGLWCDPCRERRRVALVADTAGIDAEKEYIADKLRRSDSPSLVMAEVRLREVVNGSPGSIVQVAHDDLRELLMAYRAAAALRTPKPEGEPE